MDCVALLIGTSSEYLGRRPLPRLLKRRPVLIVLGPHGVGKTSVARRVLGPSAMVLKGQILQDAAAAAVRRRNWPEELKTTEALLIDGPTLLNRRPGVTRLLCALIRHRAEAGLPTAVCQGSGDDSVLLLADEIDAGHRVTLNLRFPTRRGRVRWASRLCQQLGLEKELARVVHPEDEWTYLKVIRALNRSKREQESSLER